MNQETDDIPVLLVTEALETEGFGIEEAASGHAGLEAFQRVRPSLVLLDVTMLGMSGFECCERMRRLPGGFETLVQRVPEAERPEWMHSFMKLHSEGAGYGLEHRVVRRDGSEQTVFQQAEALHEQGRLALLRATLQDITDHEAGSGNDRPAREAEAATIESPVVAEKLAAVSAL